MTTIIDAHSHLWLKQDTTWNGLTIRSKAGGRADFLGQEVQMTPPFLVDGRNSAEAFLSNMDYAQVSTAVVVQELIDGCQNDYLAQVVSRWPDRFVVCGMVNLLHPQATADEYVRQTIELHRQGFRGMAIPGHRLLLAARRLRLGAPRVRRVYRQMERLGMFLSVTLADGDLQVDELREVIQECPTLRIAIGHFGMPTCPGWEQQVLLARYPNVYIEAGGITWLYHSEFYPYPSAVRAIREAAAMVGMEKLMWGSDYPRTITAITYRMSYDFILKSSELTEAEKQLFLGGNAMRFYGIRPEIELPYIKNMSE